jgi:hypothetical protein
MHWPSRHAFDYYSSLEKVRTLVVLCATGQINFFLEDGSVQGYMWTDTTFSRSYATVFFLPAVSPEVMVYDNRMRSTAPLYGNIRNKMDTNLNAYCNECNKPLQSSARIFGLWTVCHRWPHCDVPSVPVNWNKIFCSLILVHVVPLAPSLQLHPTVDTYPPFAITSPWQHRLNVLLLICNECRA